jgi:hypothetical protein
MMNKLKIVLMSLMLVSGFINGMGEKQALIDAYQKSIDANIGHIDRLLSHKKKLASEVRDEAMKELVATYAKEHERNVNSYTYDFYANPAAINQSFLNLKEKIEKIEASSKQIKKLEELKDLRSELNEKADLFENLMEDKMRQAQADNQTAMIHALNNLQQEYDEIWKAVHEGGLEQELLAYKHFYLPKLEDVYKKLESLTASGAEKKTPSQSPDGSDSDQPEPGPEGGAKRKIDGVAWKKPVALIGAGVVGLAAVGGAVYAGLSLYNKQRINNVLKQYGKTIFDLSAAEKDLAAIFANARWMWLAAPNYVQKRVKNLQIADPIAPWLWPVYAELYFGRKPTEARIEQVKELIL